MLADGVYVYEAEQNLLRPCVAGDVRGAIGSAPAAHAAVTIVYVAAAKEDFAQVDVGFIGQNVYLFAASEGLNAWFYAVHAQDVAARLGLGADRGYFMRSRSAIRLNRLARASRESSASNLRRRPRGRLSHWLARPPACD